MNITKLLDTSYNVLNTLVSEGEGDISSQDLMYLSSSIKVLDSLSFNEVSFIRDFKKSLSDIDDNISKIIKDKSDSLNVQSRSYYIPSVMIDKNITNSEYRFIEISDNELIFIRGLKDKSRYEFFYTKDRCKTWKNILSLYSITSNSFYFKDGLKGISICKDKSIYNSNEVDCFRLFWIDNTNKLKTGVIIDEIDYINNEFSLDESSDTKGEKILSGRNINGDVLVSYTVGNTVKALFRSNTKIEKIDTESNKDRLEERVNSWTSCKIDNGSTKENLTNLIVVNDIFYQVISNNSNRWFLSIIFKNNYNEIISQSLIYNTSNCNNIQMYLTTFTGNRLLITTNSTTEMFKIDVNDDNDISKFKVDTISYGINNNTHLTKVFSNGYYINNNNKLNKNSNIYLYLLPYNIKYDSTPVIYNESIKTFLAKDMNNDTTFRIIYEDEIMNQYQTYKG